MAAVSQAGHKVPILLAGTAAGDFAASMSPYGMCLEVLGESIGQASAVKMCRSVIMKGVEALILECLLAANRYGVEERVLSSLSRSMQGFDWAKWADYITGRTALHAERRAQELEEASRSLEAIGVEPLMTSAANRRLLWAAGLGLEKRFAGKMPRTYRDVISAIQKED
jgi:3-hydroxyisobutyrate dehydrogenase-like beta-hydroxyacid dehydrogenase